MGNRHRADEELLETRLDGGLDLLDAPHDVLDLGASGAVEERDPCSGACRVTGGGDVGGIAVRNQTEDERVHGVDVAAEGAREADAVDAIDPVVLEQERAARVESGLRELNLADVVLGDRELRLSVGEHVGERPPIRDDAGRAGRECSVDCAVRRQHAR